MPIYDQTYRKYEARAALRKARFWPITREALRLVLARRAFLLLLMAAWAPFLYWVVRIYVVTQFPEIGRLLPADARLFGQFLSGQTLFTLFLSIFGGAGLIASDLRTGAILVYLSRPLTRRDYVIGKLGVLLALNASVTLIPALLLYGIALALAPGQFLKWELAWLGPAVVLHSLVICLSTSLLALAVSSLSRSARVAGLGFFGLVIGLDLVRGILRSIYGRPEALLISFQANLQSLASALFGLKDRALDVPWPYPAIVLLLVCLGCLAILRSRVRAVEIVT